VESGSSKVAQKITYVKRKILLTEALHAVTRFIWFLLKMWFFETFSRILASMVISSG
jgi:hypothetical protein